ncbi:flagellar biosynthesis anti-sigma factor FlgM [Sphingobium sp. DEHP117]|uniref:flagellar biosynthesis anti-sigma factor FlgM n=1 Tax=Sphingobium sp. DEHP117 TaxID=2993436 RepID=UPI0027D71331|nr:flagellar biosynthesis anti-sigma factor FlgM [Sphingobium sp. DEHP117]MDQ4419440.1 flagellar biosynthesis anti-sigma factor FlgM [Sphingobium sp. DEHP117]
MIKSVGPSYGTPVGLGSVRENGKSKAADKIGHGNAVASVASSNATPIRNMADEGAPVDFDKVLAIKEAIANGKYPVNADVIAERMIALDLGE